MKELLEKAKTLKKEKLEGKEGGRDSERRS
jgi:hypothetical protein